ncbi:hypothetical protein PM082_019614 [Marasmius tenuissimus]|nr:hypothetical protein PM082_019614 [Marasmius tenuissimus]
MTQSTEDLIYLQSARYIIVSALTAFVWDVSLNLGHDYRLLLSGKTRIGWPTIVYITTRIATFGGLLMSCALFLAQSSHCNLILKILLGGFPVFVASETLLLFFRLRAVYLPDRAVVTWFFISLFVVSACSIAIPFAASSGNIPGTEYCMIVTMNIPLAIALLLIPLVNHVAVFFAISYQLLGTSRFERVGTGRVRIRKFWILGRHLPILSRTLIQDGQIYILTFIVTTLITVITMSIESLPDVFHFILIAPHLVIENCMNGYLFRHVREAAERSSRGDNSIDPSSLFQFTSDFPSAGDDGLEGEVGRSEGFAGTNIWTPAPVAAHQLSTSSGSEREHSRT